MPVLQKRAALGWAITKRIPMGGSREHKMLHTGIEDCCGWVQGQEENSSILTPLSVSSPATPEPERWPASGRQSGQAVLLTTQAHTAVGEWAVLFSRQHVQSFGLIWHHFHLVLLWLGNVTSQARSWNIIWCVWTPPPDSTRGSRVGLQSMNDWVLTQTKHRQRPSLDDFSWLILYLWSWGKPTPRYTF